MEPIVRGPVTPRLQREPLSKCIIDCFFSPQTLTKRLVASLGYRLECSHFQRTKFWTARLAKTATSHRHKHWVSTYCNCHNISLPRCKCLPAHHASEGTLRSF